jgi:tetratricopeptide (TPR) repeat protein
MMMLKSHLLRILPPALALCVYYYALYGDFTEFKKFSPAQQSSKLSEDDSRQLLDSSEELRRQGQPEKALQLVSQLRTAYPQNHIYMRQTAELYHQLGRFKEEAAAWEEFMRVSPLPVEGCPQIGIAYQTIGQIEQAIGAFQRCVEIDSKNLDFAYYLGYAYESSRQFDRAAQIYQKAIAEDEKNMDLRVGLARVRMHQLNHTQALEIAARVLKQSPSNVDAMLVMGLSLWHQGNLSQARQYLEKGVALTSQYTEFYVALGKISEQENQKGKAREAYARALKLEPNNHEIAQRLQALQEGVR